ncbi:MAG: hypothetical protein QM689_11495 [Oscillospiraceae bacterium]
MIEIKNLYKRFGGTPVLEDISFTADDRAVYGLIGCNGVRENHAAENRRRHLPAGQRGCDRRRGAGL